MLENVDYWVKAVARAEINDKLLELRSKMPTSELGDEAVVLYFQERLYSLELSEVFFASMEEKRKDIHRRAELERSESKPDDSDIQPEPPSC